MDKVDVREKMIELIKKELLGPGSEDFSENESEELIWEKPSKRYSTGILYPRGVTNSEQEDIKSTNNENEELEKEIDVITIDNTLGEESVFDNNIDETIALTNQLKPSSMGMTFFAQGNVKTLSVIYQYGMYRKAKRIEIRKKLTELEITEIRSKMSSKSFQIKDGNIELITELTKDESKKLREEVKNIENLKLKKLLNKLIDHQYAYKRIPVKASKVKFYFDNDENYRDFNDDHIKIFVKRKYYENINKTSFTVVMINGSIVDGESNIIFQPELKITSLDNEWNLVSYSSLPMLENRMTEEERNLELLFRYKQKFGIGHGVSVEYKKTLDHWCIETTFIPEHEVVSMNFEIADIPEEVLSMEKLSSVSDLANDEILDNLEKMVKSYSLWVNQKMNDINILDSNYVEAAMKNHKNATIVLERLKKGINTLRENKSALIAFKDANYAMLMQRVQGSKRRKNIMPDDSVEVAKIYKNTDIKKAKWRAFQLAFFVMSIESLVNEKSEHRDLVDLIWVPTGGGKTEAYLALTAFTIFYRRLRGINESSGTAVIMRYTLRLLAAQQFLRATSVICACELIRREKKGVYGDEEITVGLWIGSNVTPNTDQEARVNYEKVVASKNQYDIDKYYKFQILECPWCGTKLVKKQIGGHLEGKYGLGTDKKKVIHKCTNKNCDFHRKLPVAVVDDYIYERPPTLLFATVDKFATLPWKGEVSEIFASGDDITATPELIIQDELHLISGPLGTIVGLYETVIDHLCSQKGRKPKIIASTATIRNAREQVRNLYNRDVSQFPPPMIDIDDSYFIKSNSLNEKFGRKYLGIMASGKTQTTVEIRLMGKLLQSIKNIDCNDDLKDAYWTLVGYFNSIRELGKCTTLVNDDIKDFMRRLSNRSGDELRYVYQADELTSRVSSNDILKTLDKLELIYRSDNREHKVYASDIVLATNMISVGVDVSRLNLMVIVGQPKLTAEYIQASSRVGRRDPGLVFTLYDSAKTRDRSHYENFKSYHDSFYYYVEPTSLTPFSEAALDRALHALIITLMRHSFGFNSEEDAGKFIEDGEYITEIKKILIERVSIIDPDASKIVKEKIDSFFEFWKNKIEGLEEGRELRYTFTGKNGQFSRLLRDYGKNENENAYETLRAMRNVDTETRVHLRRLKK
ncbi:helicase-related protein [Fusibacter ferrireducens]|uniref:DEAD/DEAH box helicase n=1 Tax=Fusibacter ferrireducens TaxID=2785058 RepID=A0ABR9ZZX8_9FIRM|nr:helicase-related protein [Fusibacter ferrireducens]MBF4695993.1 DEAD/DEAH box helicase [Fusibacter ferrireducens]